MTHLRDLDPDAFLRERIFQRLVDATGMDPQNAARISYRFHVLGMVGFVITFWPWAFPYLQQANQPALLPAILFIPVAFQVINIGWQIRLPSVIGLDPFRAVQRILLMITTGFSTHLAVGTLLGGPGPVVVFFMVCFGLGWPMGPVAWYLHMCRRPPPRRRGEARSLQRPAFSGR